MKIEEQNVATFNMGIKETSRANITVNAKMFEILSGVYSDPELAIVREIAANAWDSHKKCGYPDRPFDVQIPNSLDPRFRVRDYGTSMTHEFVMNNLNNYGDSTKDDNNDEIGGFGLGMKSPFCYTSSFMIACYLDGKRRVYAYQIGSDNIPEINFMAEGDTDEANGVEISIPVGENDYHKFASAVQKTFAFYDVKPNLGGLELEIPEFEKLIDHDDWFICRRSSIFDQSVYVEMGGIAYPVDRNIHGVGYYGYDQTLFLKAAIGDVDVTPNREQVKLTQKTIKFVNDSISNLKNTIFDEMQKMIDEIQIDNYWDIVPTLAKMNGSLADAVGLKVENLAINGKKYPDTKFEVRRMPKPTTNSDGTVNKVDVLDSMVDNIEKIGSWKLTSSSRVKRTYNDWNGNYIILNRLTESYNDTIIVMEPRQAAHVSRWMKENESGRIWAVHALEGQAQAVVDAIKDRTEFYPNVFTADELEVTPVAKNATARKFYIYHSDRYRPVVREEIDMTVLGDEVYYFETDGRQCGMVNGHEIQFKHQRNFVDYVAEWVGDDVYYLTPALIKKIGKLRPDVELIKAEDALNDMLKSKVEDAAPHYAVDGLEEIERYFTNKISHWSYENIMEFWAKRYGFDDYLKARKELEDYTSDSTVEHMCHKLQGKSIHEMFEQYGIEIKKVSCGSFNDLVTKMPYISSLARDGREPAVLTHIEDVMGWTPVIEKTV